MWSSAPAWGLSDSDEYRDGPGGGGSKGVVHSVVCHLLGLDGTGWDWTR
jgi:hypothetical protein